MKKMIKMKWLGILTLTAILAVLAFAAAANIAGNQDEEEPEFLAVDPAQLGSAVRDVGRSVGIVFLKDSDYSIPLGTAWLVEAGRMATAFNVVKSYTELEEDQYLFVRGTGRVPDAARVTGILPHPSYAPLLEARDLFAPAWRTGPHEWDDRFTVDAAYDVAILEVADTSEFGPPLPLAPIEELRQIAAGSTVAYVGHPISSYRAFSRTYPQPLLETAKIARVTNFLGNLAAREDNQLFQLAVSASGLAGSPVLAPSSGNPAGYAVIGMFTTGNTDLKTAQRINGLIDLLNGNSEERSAWQVRQWRRALESTYVSGAELERWDERHAYLSDAFTPTGLDSRVDVNLERLVEAGFDDRAPTLTVNEPGEYLVVLTADDLDDDESRVFVDPADGPPVEYRLEHVGWRKNPGILAAKFSVEQPVSIYPRARGKDYGDDFELFLYRIVRHTRSIDEAIEDRKTEWLEQEGDGFHAEIVRNVTLPFASENYVDVTLQLEPGSYMATAATLDVSDIDLNVRNPESDSTWAYGSDGRDFASDANPVGSFSLDEAKEVVVRIFIRDTDEGDVRVSVFRLTETNA